MPWARRGGGPIVVPLRHPCWLALLLLQSQGPPGPPLPGLGSEPFMGISWIHAECWLHADSLRWGPCVLDVGLSVMSGFPPRGPVVTALTLNRGSLIQNRVSRTTVQLKRQFRRAAVTTK